MPDVRMNYDSMENMAKAFHRAHQQVHDSMREMERQVKLMEDGALQGEGGDAFQDAIKNQLLRRMKMLAEKLEELEQDVRAAVRATRDGVRDSQRRFQD